MLAGDAGCVEHGGDFFAQLLGQLRRVVGRLGAGGSLGALGATNGLAEARAHLGFAILRIAERFGDSDQIGANLRLIESTTLKVELLACNLRRFHRRVDNILR